jgi:hypothetical protein
MMTAVDVEIAERKKTLREAGYKMPFYHRM